MVRADVGKEAASRGGREPAPGWNGGWGAHYGNTSAPMRTEGQPAAISAAAQGMCDVIHHEGCSVYIQPQGLFGPTHSPQWHPCAAHLLCQALGMHGFPGGYINPTLHGNRIPICAPRNLLDLFLGQMINGLDAQGCPINDHPTGASPPRFLGSKFSSHGAFLAASWGGRDVLVQWSPCSRDRDLRPGEGNGTPMLTQVPHGAWRPNCHPLSTRNSTKATITHRATFGSASRKQQWFSHSLSPPLFP